MKSVSSDMACLKRHNPDIEIQGVSFTNAFLMFKLVPSHWSEKKNW